MELEFTGEYDKSTFYKAVVMTGLPSRKNNLVRMALFALAIFGFVAAVVIPLVQSELDTFKSLRAVIVFPLIAYFLLQPYVAGWIAANRLWKDPSTREPLAGVITTQGISYVSGAHRNEIRWESFARIKKVKDWIALLTADGSILVFPQRFFRNDEDWQRFQKWVDLKVVEP